MSKLLFPVLVESRDGRKLTGLSMLPKEEPFRISMKIREHGFMPYKVRFDANAQAWLVSVIDWKPIAAE